MKLLQIIFLGLAKPIGPLWFILVARHWRHEARNAVANHVLQNDLRHRLDRLWQRDPQYDSDNHWWVLKPFDPWTEGMGFVYERRHSKMKLWLLFWLVYIWCDDDSTSDTYDDGHARELGLSVPDEYDSKYFDHGDDQDKRFRWYPALRWNMRNTMMNFKYYFMGY